MAAVSLEGQQTVADAAWRLAPTVVLRPEPFGALAYDFRTRSLSFLKSPSMVRFVSALADSPSARKALEGAGIPGEEQSRHLTALAALVRSGMVVGRVVDSEVRP